MLREGDTLVIDCCDLPTKTILWYQNEVDKPCYSGGYSYLELF